MVQPVVLDLSLGRETGTIATTIDERLSQELIIAMVGPVGSGVSTSASYIAEILKTEFEYNVAPIIKMSGIIKEEAHRVGRGNASTKPLSRYIDEMQTAGNDLREKFGKNYLAEKAVEKIVKFRTQDHGYNEVGISLPGRRAYIIDSLKNLEELSLFQQIYRDILCVFGVFAPDIIRKRRLINDGAQEGDVQKILDRDRGEVLTFGQMTQKIFTLADFFIRNDKKEDELRRQILRYLEMVFDSNIHTPTKAEAAMYEASAAGANSACMSRQVGAAIVSPSGELISVGWNDVPRQGGGLYSEDDQSNWDDDAKVILDADNRCFKWQNKICHNQTRRNTILDDIAKKIADSSAVKAGTKPAEILALLIGTDVDNLTEFSRSIHAEMEAVLAIAREGRHALVGATLYTTTYPCHNCARHIVAAGISTVIYIKPYQKSLAITLHNDAITEDQSEKNKKVLFAQYDGVAPQQFLRLFTPKTERKLKGLFARPDPKTAVPIFRVPLDAPVEYESKVIADLSDKEHS
jgi:deoxycytidylate deaminase